MTFIWLRWHSIKAWQHEVANWSSRGALFQLSWAAGLSYFEENCRHILIIAHLLNKDIGLFAYSVVIKPVLHQAAHLGYQFFNFTSRALIGLCKEDVQVHSLYVWRHVEKNKMKKGQYPSGSKPTTSLSLIVYLQFSEFQRTGIGLRCEPTILPIGDLEIRRSEILRQIKPLFYNLCHEVLCL